MKLSRSPDRFPAPWRLNGCARRAAFQHFAEVQNRNLRGDVEHHVHVVLDQENRDAGIEFHEELGHLGGFARRQAGGRLVEQQDVRIAGKAEHDFELALLAVGEIAHFDILAVEEPHLLEQMISLVVDVAIR